MLPFSSPTYMLLTCRLFTPLPEIFFFNFFPRYFARYARGVHEYRDAPPRMQCARCCRLLRAALFRYAIFDV